MTPMWGFCIIWPYYPMGHNKDVVSAWGGGGVCLSHLTLDIFFDR